jgi:hypothetical protein
MWGVKKRAGTSGVAFDLMHVAGDHDTSAVLRDVRQYLPLVRPVGSVVMDDVSWDPVRPAVREAASQARLLPHGLAPESGGDCAVFRKGGRWLAATVLSRRLHRLARPQPSNPPRWWARDQRCWAEHARAS